MTNYNERLNEILLNVAIRGAGKKQDDDYVSEAKRAITSLNKELVAEAKPEDDCMDCNGVTDFEHNLLKALEEV